MRKGFTLVELAIVLVIIGLLIGGILVAQSMIATSRITAQVAQLQQFDAGVMSFKAKYNYIPGDAPAFGGDGDGILGMTNGVGMGNQDANNSFACEIALFWSSMMPETYSTNAACTPSGPFPPPITNGTSKNVPLAKIGKNGSFIVASGIGVLGGNMNYAAGNATYTPGSVARNFYAITSLPQGAGNGGVAFIDSTTANSTVKPQDALALDSKIDNGVANTGNVVSGAFGQAANVGGMVENPLPECSTTGTYNLSTRTETCTPLIRIGAQVGDPQ